jgi:hypothetical protein
MARVGAGQPADDLQPLLISRERAGEIALRKKNVARPDEAGPQVALALGMARIGARQAASDREPLLVAR